MKKVLLAATLALPMFAQASGYAGLDIISSKIEPDNTSGSAKPNALQFKFGTWINRDETLGGELRLAHGAVSSPGLLYPLPGPPTLSCALP